MSGASPPTSARAYGACVPHVPFVSLQQRALLPGFWAAYEARIAEFRAFDPELVIAFGADHYDGLHLKLMPSMLVGLIAEAMADTGGFPGRLDIPRDIAMALAEFLVEQEFDIAFSYAMSLDHGFSSVLHHFLGAIDARPVIPVHINALCHPRPTLRRCRRLGEAIGRYAAGLGQRVAFLGSGGLSHDTSNIFPQYDAAPDEAIRDFIVHGGTRGPITHAAWLATGHAVMDQLLAPVAARTHTNGRNNEAWDRRFLRELTGPDLAAFDAWRDDEMVAAAGSGAGEIRQWVAAMAAARAAGAGAVCLDFYEADNALDVGTAVVHAPAPG